MKRFSGAIFDADGTLIDSLYKWEHAPSEYLKSLGITDTGDIDERAAELSFLKGCELLQNEFLPDLSAEMIQNGIMTMMEEFYKNEAELLPGVKEYVLHLHADGVKLSIATAGSKELIEAALKRHGIAECFVGIYSCDELGCGKERPDIYELSLKLLNVKKEDAVVFEDSKTAADTAKRAGFNVCLVKQDTFIKRTI